jgi:hypothetical protein
MGHADGDAAVSYTNARNQLTGASLRDVPSRLAGGTVIETRS